MIDFSGTGLNDCELAHEAEGIIDEPVVENHEAVERASWAAEFFRGVVEFKLAVVLAL